MNQQTQRIISHTPPAVLESIIETAAEAGRDAAIEAWDTYFTDNIWTHPNNGMDAPAPSLEELSIALSTVLADPQPSSQKLIKATAQLVDLIEQIEAVHAILMEQQHQDRIAIEAAAAATGGNAPYDPDDKPTPST